MDPAGMPSSRAFSNVPLGFKAAMFIIGHSIAPVARYFTPRLNTPANAGRELVALSVGPEGEGVRGYFLRLQLKESSVQSQDEEKQKEVWADCEKWVMLDPSETVLSLSGDA
jgi:WW domain-containing oxidoreductase